MKIKSQIVALPAIFLMFVIASYAFADALGDAIAENLREANQESVCRIKVVRTGSTASAISCSKTTVTKSCKALTTSSYAGDSVTNCR